MRTLMHFMRYIDLCTRLCVIRKPGTRIYGVLIDGLLVKSYIQCFAKPL